MKTLKGKRMYRTTKRLVAIQKVLYLTVFLIVTLVTLLFSQNKALLFDLNLPTLNNDERRVLTLKLKNTIESTSEMFVTLWSDLPDSLRVGQFICKNKNDATNILKQSEYDVVIWGEIGSVDSVFLTSIYLVKKDTGSTILYNVYQDEVNGTLADVLKYSLYNISMEITGKKENKIHKYNSNTINSNQGSEVRMGTATPLDSGFLIVKVPSERIRVYINSTFAGYGNVTIKVNTGVNHVSAKNNSSEVKTKSTEVFKNDTSYITFGIDSFPDEKTIKFFMGFDASWMNGLGDRIWAQSYCRTRIKKEISFSNKLLLGYSWTYWI